MTLFPGRLKHLREKKNLTLEGLANELNISKSLLWDLEQGRRRVHGELLLRIACFFNVTTDYMLGLSEHGEKERAEHIIGSDAVVYDLDAEMILIIDKLKNLSPRGREQLKQAVEWVSEMDERERKSRRNKN